ncbi:hypothetical protein QQS21_008256 [Conoideocrella luteorostrata]|uniref:Uncharacterized protein n=1 Tax=Conoideocrella luteorostrata TaxID=1105319 RepID=A0AAJ0CLZ2_9HYPO|nr:hypothetical protein QQS21_008256 [Conoideocrella luteorostrata]
MYCEQIRFDSGIEVLAGSHEEQPQDFVSLLNPQTLIYRKDDTLPIDFVGAFSPEQTLINTTAPNLSIPSQMILGRTCISLASLEHASLITAYYASGTQLCRGLIIQYQKGGQLALGECKLGVDGFKVYKWPARLCFVQQSGVGVKIECAEDLIHVHENAKWTCCQMSGVLYCWFRYDFMKLEHRKEEVTDERDTVQEEDIADLRSRSRSTFCVKGYNIR